MPVMNKPEVAFKEFLHACKYKRINSRKPTSYNVRSLPPLIFHTIPVALSMPISSKRD